MISKMHFKAAVLMWIFCCPMVMGPYKASLPVGGGELSLRALSRDPFPHISLQLRLSKCFTDFIGKYQHLGFTGNV